ncbi:MAG: coproporphyrinogen-III oxidase family protein, partial [Verrucomicrobiota bacterium]
SLGVQAFDQGSLKVLGRTHSANDVVESVQILRRAGFANINIDLMFNLPGQTVEIWKDSLQQAVALEPDHLSLYQLTYEEDTDFFEKLRRGEMKEEPLGREMYARGIEYLGRHGYEHYEISNFARPGFEARHNQACWRGEDYLGLGPSACSTVGEWRWQTVSDISAYGQDPLQRKWEPLAPETRQQERVILGLRTREGIPRGWISGKDRFLEEMENQGLLLVRSQRIILTPEGRMIADSILEEIV